MKDARERPRLTVEMETKGVLLDGNFVWRGIHGRPGQQAFSMGQ